MNPQFDEKDEAEKLSRFAEYNLIKGARVGDFILMRDGTIRRFTHDWAEDGLQTTIGSGECARDQSFYHGGSFVSFSGSLDHTIPLHEIESTNEIQHGSFWFFHHNQVQAHNGVYFRLPCRVFKQKARSVSGNGQATTATT